MRGGWEMTLRSGATGVRKPGHKSQALDEPQMLESSLCEGERKLIRDTSKPIQSAKHAKVASTAFTLGSKSLFGVSNQSITLSLHRCTFYPLCFYALVPRKADVEAGFAERLAEGS